MRLPRLYPIVDVDVCRGRGLDPLAVTAAFLAGGTRLIQIRDKSSSSAAQIELVQAIVRLAHDAAAQVIVNDRADIARMCGADGVHVGQDDLSVGDVRTVLGEGAIVGLSTHDERQIDAAVQTTASYIAVGPVYGTVTKDTGYSARGLDLVAGAARTGRPVVAIGGITLQRAPEVMAAGAASVAVISDLLVGDPRDRVRAFIDALGDI
jgi:thiamine-phosphate pyrophosphorylase